MVLPADVDRCLNYVEATKRECIYPGASHEGPERGAWPLAGGVGEKMTGAQQLAAKPPPAVVSPSPLTCYPLIIRERQ